MANRKVTPLTDTTIRNAKPKEKDYTLPDGDGLQLLIKQDGRKVWEIRYTHEGKPKKTTFGVYPTVTLLMARLQRDEYRTLIKQGVNPIQERKNAKQQTIQEKELEQEEITRQKNTFEKVARDFIQSIENRTVPRYYSLKLARLENHVFPYIGKIPIDEVKRLDLVECLERLKNAQKDETARRVHNIIGQVYKYAVTRELAPHNITADIDTRFVIGKKEENHFSTITDPQEIGKLFRAIESYQGETTVKLAVKLSYLTAQRPYNIRFAEWEEFNLNTNEWNITAEKMKMKRSHVVPLTPQIKAILEELRPLTQHKSKYLFPSLVTNLKPISENTVNQALRRLGYSKEEIVAHGFRAMFSTTANENIPTHGYHSDVIERHLAHKETNKIKGAYNHAEYLNERKGLIQWWCDFCDELRDNAY